MTAIPSTDNENRWYIFRDNGQEVVILMRNGRIEKTSHFLKPFEEKELIRRTKQTSFPIVNNLKK